MMIAQSIVLFMAGIVTATSLGYGTLEEHEYDRPGSIDTDIREMVNKMTLSEKVGQMTQLNQDLIFTKEGQLNASAVAYYAKNYHVGSYLNQLAKYFTRQQWEDEKKGMLTLFFSYFFDSNGVNYDHANYARILDEIQRISLEASNDTFKIPIIYG
jgi:beta-glucosidase